MLHLRGAQGAERSDNGCWTSFSVKITTLIPTSSVRFSSYYLIPLVPDSMAETTNNLLGP
jgi:hypothetical protein